MVDSLLSTNSYCQWGQCVWVSVWEFNILTITHHWHCFALFSRTCSVQVQLLVNKHQLHFFNISMNITCRLVPKVLLHHEILISFCPYYILLYMWCEVLIWVSVLCGHLQQQQQRQRSRVRHLFSPLLSANTHRCYWAAVLMSTLVLALVFSKNLPSPTLCLLSDGDVRRIAVVAAVVSPSHAALCGGCTTELFLTGAKRFFKTNHKTE